MKKIGERDKNNIDICIGDKVRFKFYGQHYFTATVEEWSTGEIYPFADIPVECGFSVSPDECEIIERGEKNEIKKM